MADEYYIDSRKYPRFCGIRTFYRLPYKNNLDGVDFILAGIPFDTATAFKTGARFGPSAIREESIALRPYNPILKVNIYEDANGIDFGDLPVIPGYIEESFSVIKKNLVPILKKNIIPILFGGDHSITLPILRAFNSVFGKVSLLHFDSHSDTWDEYFGQKYNHATTFRRAIEEDLIDTSSSIQVGLRGTTYGPEDMEGISALGLSYLTAQDIREKGFDETVSIIKKKLGSNLIFLSFDIDFLDPAYAPATGFPECGGFTSYEALTLIHKLSDLNIIGFDLVEVIPAYDASRITSVVASQIGFEFCCIASKIKRKKSEKRS